MSVGGGCGSEEEWIESSYTKIGACSIAAIMS